MTARTLDVAGIAVRFTGDAAALDVVDRRYAPFLRPASPADRPVEIELCLRPVANTPPDVVEPSVALDAGGFVLTASGLRASIAGDRMSARIEAPLAERPIDAVLRILLASHLLERGGLLLHASAVVIAGRAWVFAGPSGVGKTTLATTLQGELLCDEAVAVIPDGRGAAAHATPYWRARPAHAAIAGLVFPVRGPQPIWRELSAGRAFARLVSCAGPLLPGALPDALDAAHRIVAAVPRAEVALSSISDIQDWLQERLC